MFLLTVEQLGGGGDHAVGQYPTPREALEALAEHESWLVPPFTARVERVSDQTEVFV